MISRTTHPNYDRERRERPKRSFARSHHRASLRGRTATLSDSLSGDPRGVRGYQKGS